MKFSDWKILNESTDLRKKAEELRKKLEKAGYNIPYVIANWEPFKREGEPEQQSILFTDEKLRTFRVNYVGSGRTFSADFWKPDSNKPVITMYHVDGSEDDFIVAAAEVAKNPSKNVKVQKIVQSKNEYISEAEDKEKLEVKITDPKPEVDLDPEAKKAEKNLEDEYDYSDPDTIFEDLKTYVGMIIKGTQPSLLITGSPGVGKTYLVTKQLKDADLIPGRDFVHVKGRSTAAGMYITLYENNGKIIVFDDCDSVFGTPDALNVLKGALDSYGTREISWLVGKPLKTSSGDIVPKSFEFTGRVIFISNMPQRKIDDAIKSRSFVVEVALTPDDMIKKMRKELPNVHPEVPLPIRKEALDFIEDAAKEAKNLELNMRTLVKAIKILRDVDDLKVAERLILQQCSYK